MVVNGSEGNRTERVKMQRTESGRQGRDQRKGAELNTIELNVRKVNGTNWNGTQEKESQQNVIGRKRP